MTYKTKGTCSTLIDIEMENTTAGIHAAENILAEKPDAIVIFLTAHETENMILMSMGGCNGNLKGISSLVVGMKAEDAIARLKGIKCGFKPTSCPDQLARALEEIVQAQ